MTDLIRLAERVEVLAGPDREVDLEIYRAIYPFPCVSLSERAQDTFDREKAPKYTASLDAAMTLVPEGWNWCVCSDERPGFANVHKLVKGEGPSNIAIAATSALALSAAAIRSLAAHRGQG